MPDHELERILKSVPIETLSPQADAEIIAIMRAAGRTRPWYARPIPLWQATAACLLLCIATGLLTRVGRTATPLATDSGSTPKHATVFVHCNEPLFADASASPDRVDISHWQVRK